MLIWMAGKVVSEYVKQGTNKETLLTCEYREIWEGNKPGGVGYSLM